MVSATDGSAFTGSVTVAVTGDGGTQATGSVGSGACTHEGGGFHTYAPAQAETNYDHVAFTFSGTGAVPVTIQLYTQFPQTGDSYGRLGAPAGASVSADVAAVKAETASILTDTAEIGVAGAGLTALATQASVNTIDDFLDTEIAAILADTNELQTDWANGGRLDLILDTAAAGGSAASYGIVDEGTAQSATGTTLVLRSAAGFANDELIGATILITGGTGVGQARTITDYVGSTDTATVDAWTTTPSGTITYKVFGTPPASATAVPAVNLVQVAGSTTDVSALATNVAAILVDTGTTLDGKLNTIDDFLDTEVAAIKTVVDDILVDTGTTLPATLATISGYVDTEVAAVLAAVDTEVAAIKAKTDSLTFTVAGNVDANIQRINDVEITGDGSATPFNVV